MCGHVKQVAVAQRYGQNPDESRRNRTQVFYFTKGDQMQVRVCKKMFSSVIEIPSGNLDRALKKECNVSFENQRVRIHRFPPTWGNERPR